MIRFRPFVLPAACAAALLCAMLGAPTAHAYPMYDDGNGVGCVSCHEPDGFQGGNGALHQQHRISFGVTTCNLCHPSGGGSTPVRTYRSGTGGGFGCAGCHGQDYGENSVTDGLPKATAYGLRQYHASHGVTECATCHAPGENGFPDPFPPLLDENVPPIYYAPAYSNLTDPCSSAEEDLTTDVDALGLDNDGDGARDYPADSDCSPPTTTTTLPPSVTSTGVTGLKLILVDKYASSAKAKAVFVSKDTTPGAIHKGIDADPPVLSGTVEIFDTNDPTNTAVYDLAGANWLVNKPTIAKYVFKTAAAGGDGVKVAIVKPDLLLKVVGKNLGDGDSATGSQGASDLDLAGLAVNDVLRVRVTIVNASDSSTHIMCSDFTIESAASISGGTGYKIVSKNSTAPGSCS